MRRKAFKSIELLVVVAVVVVLAALLLPALAKAKYTARNAVCKSNLRQLHLGLGLDTATHHSSPPFAGESDPGLSSTWWGQLDRPLVYVQKRWLSEPVHYSRALGGVFQCP